MPPSNCLDVVSCPALTSLRSRPDSREELMKLPLKELKAAASGIGALTIAAGPRLE